VGDSTLRIGLTGMSAQTALVPVVVALFLCATALWVYQDATSHAERGAPVSFSTGSIEIGTPGGWAVGCLCLWIIFMPLYLTCRKNADPGRP
jgi:hypothetical protein